MKKTFWLVLAAFLISNAAFSQANGDDYKSAVGIRIGSTYYDGVAFSYKNFISDPAALEFNFAFASRGYENNYRASSISMALAYQHHFDLGADGLKWYVGGGGTIFNTFSKNDKYSGFGLGVFPTVGLDFKFPGVPINLSADIRPTFQIVSPSYYNAFYGNLGIGARYTFR